MKKIQILLILIVCIFGINAYCQPSNLDVIKVPDPENSGETIDCGLEGSAHDSPNKLGHLAWVGNPQKNRYDIPQATAIKTIKIEDLIASNADKKKFATGTPIQVTAYVYDVKPGGVESCNCGTKDQSFKDTHIELTPNSTDTSAQFKMIVEVTPRLRQIMQQQGIDWSTATLHDKILNHTVAIQGWLFYDEIHEPQSVSTNPENKPNPKTGKRPDWRASCWEIHPITGIEVLDANEDMAAPGDEGRAETHAMAVSYPPVPQGGINIDKFSEPSFSDPGELLKVIALAALLGMSGQVIRVMAGLKKVKDTAADDKKNIRTILDENSKSILFSLLIAIIVGGVAGVLAAVSTNHIDWSQKSTIVAFITAGYAGTDFIEGFILKR